MCTREKEKNRRNQQNRVAESPHTIRVCATLVQHYSPHERFFSGWNDIVPASVRSGLIQSSQRIWYSQFSHVPTKSSTMKQMLRRFASKWQRRYGDTFFLFFHIGFFVLFPVFSLLATVDIVAAGAVTTHRSDPFIVSCSIFFKLHRFDTFCCALVLQCNIDCHLQLQNSKEQNLHSALLNIHTNELFVFVYSCVKALTHTANNYDDIDQSRR